jgi:hypothetical protein
VRIVTLDDIVHVVQEVATEFQFGGSSSGAPIPIGLLT